MRFGRNIKFIVYFHNIAVLVDCNFFSLEHLNSGKLSHIGTLNGGLKVIRIFPLQKADGAFWLYYWRFLFKFFHTGLIWDLVFEWKATMGLKMFRLIFPAVFGHLKKKLCPCIGCQKSLILGHETKFHPLDFPTFSPPFLKSFVLWEMHSGLQNSVSRPKFDDFWSFDTPHGLYKKFLNVWICWKNLVGGGVSPISLFNLEKVLAELKWLVGLKSKH